MELTGEPEDVRPHRRIIIVPHLECEGREVLDCGRVILEVDLVSLAERPQLDAAGEIVVFSFLVIFRRIFPDWLEDYSYQHELVPEGLGEM